MAAGRPATIVMDASVLMNFLRIDRMDLIAGHSHDFVVTDHVAVEISDRYPEQQQRFSEATDQGAVSQTSITRPEELSLFGSLAGSGRLGAGECAGRTDGSYSATTSARVASRSSSNGGRVR